MTSIITELVHIFVLGPADARLRVRDFLAVLKIHWGHSAIFCSLVGLLSL